MKKQVALALATLAVLEFVLGVSSVQAVVLYDGSGNQTPDNQGWLYATEPITGASATQSASGGVTTLDTMPQITDKAGYFSTIHPLMPDVIATIGPWFVDQNRVDEAHRSVVRGCNGELQDAWLELTRDYRARYASRPAPGAEP